ncbi:MAG: heavy metal translocating P-type ATPase [Candidatus Zixiibacteriota bacterium]
MNTETSEDIEIILTETPQSRKARELSDRLKTVDGLSDIRIDRENRRIIFRMTQPDDNREKMQKAMTEIKNTGLSVASDSREVQVLNMRCAGCVAALENGLKKVPGITDVRVNFATQTAQVDFVSDVYNPRRLIADIKEVGYEAEFKPDENRDKAEIYNQKKNLAIAFFGAALIFIIHFSQHMLSILHLPIAVSATVQFFLAIPVLYAGREFFADAVNQTRHKRANMNSLIALGSGTAFLYSTFVTGHILFGSSPASHTVYFETTAMIILFILIGRFLEKKATVEARDAALGMASLIPDTVTRVKADGTEEEIPSDDLLVGDTVIVRPGQSIPADGVVISGETAVDESILTGESLPVAKNPADNVIGGTVNMSGGIKMKTTRVGAGSVLGRMIRMVRDAQGKKAPIQRLADRVAGKFVPVIIIIALVTLFVWMIASPGSTMILTAPVAVLLIACPCALGLATPTAILVATGRAARLGILFKNGEILERLSRANCFVFDKTGTLTEGHPSVDEIIPAERFGAEKLSPTELVRIAASAEQMSEHPYGKAICRRAKKDGSKLSTVDKHEYKPGEGIIAEVDGKTIVAGKRKFIAALKLPKEQQDLLDAVAKKEGTAIVHVAMDNEYLGAITLSDTVKKDAQQAVETIISEGREVVMLTGDNYSSASVVAAKVGITRIEAEADPKKKLATIHTLSRTGYTTAMVGDGVNDAAALTTADIGIAIGSGADIAVKASDITITGKSLVSLLTALKLSKMTLRIIKQNLFWAFIYNMIMIPIAAGLLYPIGISFSPAFAAAAMALSSVFVVTNSLRLKKVAPVASNFIEA